MGGIEVTGGADFGDLGSSSPTFILCVVFLSRPLTNRHRQDGDRQLDHPRVPITRDWKANLGPETILVIHLDWSVVV